MKNAAKVVYCRAVDRLSIFGIEPKLSIEPLAHALNTDAVAYDYICKCYLNEQKTDFVYMYASGEDYCTYFSGSTKNAYAQDYFPALQVFVSIAFADSLAEGLADEIGGTKLYSFEGIGEQAEYNDADAQLFTAGLAENTPVYAEKVYSVEPVSYTYHNGSTTFMETQYELSYLICECAIDDSEQSKIYIAISEEDYLSAIDPNATIEWDSSSMFSQLSGNLEKVFFNDPITIYGYAKDADGITDGLSDTTGDTILLFVHLG